MTTENTQNSANKKVIALIKNENLRERLNCKEWATLENIKIIGITDSKDLALLRGLAHFSLKDIDLNDAEMELLPDGVFAECENLVSINLNDQWTVLPPMAFNKCINLKQVKLPKELRKIGEMSLKDCVSVEKITLPCGLRSIEQEAFAGCRNLTAITCLAETPPRCDATAFENTSSDRITVKVPLASKQQYIENELWNKFKITALTAEDIEI